MKPKMLWVLKTRYGYVRDPHYHSPLGTLFFKTRRAAEDWLTDHPYWVTLKARPVKVMLHLTELAL